MTPEAIISEVAKFYNVSVADIHRADRHKSIARARSVAVYFIRQSGLGVVEIGRLLGQDHTTVSFDCKKINAELELDLPRAEEIRYLQKVLFGESG